MSDDLMWIGWVSSFLLVLTVAKQIHKQWKERTSKGVSSWLFLGQLAAEIGFIIYSVSVRNWVFVFTNVALVIENLVGYWLVLKFRTEEQGHGRSARASSFANQ